MDQPEDVGGGVTTLKTAFHSLSLLIHVYDEVSSLFYTLCLK